MDYYEIYDTYGEITAAAEYEEQRMHFNVDLHGQAEPNDEALVPITCACPKCGEMRMDCLSLDEDIVTCTTCGTIYDILDSDGDTWSDRYALAHPGALM